MTAIYHPGVVQIVPHNDIGSGRDACNVLYFQTAAIGLTTAQLLTVQAAFDTAWENFWKTRRSSNCLYKGSIVTDMGSNTGGQVTNSTFVPVAGTGAATELGDNTAVLISLKTATRYRGGHGRIYMPANSNAVANNDGRTVTAAQITSITTAFATFTTAMAAITGAAGGPYQQILWHKKWAAAPNTTEVVLTGVPQVVLATQRRRLRKVSRHKSA